MADPQLRENRAPGWGRPKPRTKRRVGLLPRVGLLLVGPILILLLIAVALALVSARTSLSAGLHEMRLAEAEVKNNAAQENPIRIVQRTRRHVKRANDDFGDANAKLSPLGPLLRNLSWLPGIGDQLAAAPVAAKMARQTTSGLLPMIRGLDPLAAQLGTQGRRDSSTLPILLTTVNGQHDAFERGCRSLSDAMHSRTELHAYSSKSLSSSLRTFDARVPGLLVLCRTLAALPQIAGFKQPQTYLVAYQNPDELRATGGYIGSAGLVTLQRGRLTQQFHGTWLKRQNWTVPAPEPMARYNTELAWLFMDSNWSPDFPTSANLERYFLDLNLHREAQGVIDVTPQAAAYVLRATGPVYSSEYGQWVTSSNIGALADYYAHWTVAHGPYKFPTPDTSRKQFIQIISRHILERLNHLSSHQWVQLATNVSSAVAHKDILMNFQNRQAQNLTTLAGAGGSLSNRPGDFLSIVDSNLSYNKINPYVHMSASYQTQIRSDHWLHSRLTIRFQNVGAPASKQAGWGPGGGAYGHWDDYATFLRVYVPPGAQLLSQSGWDQWPAGTAYVKSMYSGYLIVYAGTSKTVHLEYVLPPNVFTWSNGSRYRLVIPYQPGSHPDAIHVAVKQAGGPSFSWMVRRPQEDWVRTVAVHGGSFHPIPLPASPAHPLVAPGHLIEPFAYLTRPGKKPL